VTEVLSLEPGAWSYPKPLPEGPQLQGYKVFRDIVWSYQEPLPEGTPTAHFLCMYNECVDAIFVEDELMPVSTTIWSE
jgi:uncharacterized protein (DUF427 family)